MQKLFITFFLFFISTVVIYAQQSLIKGQVIDVHSKEPLKAITVLLKDEHNKILAYKMTDKEGNFKILTSKDLQSTYLEINHLGYKRKRIEGVVSSEKVITISLEVSTILLDDVEIKSRPRVSQQGDTLSYDVSSFAKVEDRSIGDVLKRMPGIEVSESGQIKYQGKSISNFYIDGDDLLSDKYKIGTNTIRHNMVKDVQVLNNHEHMKVLKNKRYSDEVALNLVIKDDAKLKLTGQAKLGAGLPEQYDLEGNTILFNKKYKGLNVLQANNVGRDLTSDVKGFNSNSVLTKLGVNPINNLLSLGTVGNPPIARQHYLFNNSVGLNANNLINLKRKWQIVSNIQAVFDRNTKDFSGFTQYYSDSDTITFSEEQRSKAEQKLASLSLKATKNESNQYIENLLLMEYEKDLSKADIVSNNASYFLRRSHEIVGFRNSLNYVPALKNGNIIQVSWFVDYGNKPQNLEVAPGVFTSILADGKPYAKSFQYVEVPSFSTNASIGYRLPMGFLNQYYGFQATIDDQKLKTYMAKEVEGSQYRIDTDSTRNNMHWLRTNVAFHATYEFLRVRFSSRLNLPISYQTTLYKDPGHSLNQSQGRILFSPSYSARYLVDKEGELSFSYARGNSFGNIEDVYRGLIIRNYRTISSNTSGINSSTSDSFDLGFKTGKTLKLMFYNIGLNYKRSVSSTMLSNNVNENISSTELIEQENIVNSYGLSTGFDKYLFGLSSTVKLKTAISWVDFNQLFNAELLPFQNVSYTISPLIDARLWKKLNLSYSANVSITNSKQKNGLGALNRESLNVSQQLAFPITVYSKFHFNISGRHLFSHQVGLKNINYLFVDTFIRYKHQKWKADFDLTLSNIGNIKRFEVYQTSANMENQNSYQLRGRMIVLKTVFNL